MFTPTTPFGGLRIVEDRYLVDMVEDWSEVRAPSRAARRRKRGFPQRIKFREVPKSDAFVMQREGIVAMHPETAKEFRRLLALQASG